MAPSIRTDWSIMKVQKRIKHKSLRTLTGADLLPKKKKTGAVQFRSILNAAHTGLVHSPVGWTSSIRKQVGSAYICLGPDRLPDSAAKHV